MNNFTRQKVGEPGQAILVFLIFTLVISLILVGRGANPARTDSVLARGLLDSKRSSLLSEAATEDAVYRIMNGISIDDTEIMNIDGYYATTTIVTDELAHTKTVSVAASVRSEIRNKLVELVEGEAVSFNYGVQCDLGGFSMFNTSSVVGNIYCNGQVTGADNMIKGSIVSATNTGSVNSIHATSSVYAHTISNSTIDKDAYYQTKISTTVLGTSYPGSVDKPTTSLPLSEATLDSWEADAMAGGTIGCPPMMGPPYRIPSNTTIGPKMILCDLEISNNVTVTLSGTVWVVGNITIKNNNLINIHPLIGAGSVALIADNPVSRATSGKITVSNATVFSDSGTAGSFIFLVSRNNGSFNNSQTTRAIDVLQSVNGKAVLYSNFGGIHMSNSSKLKAVAGWAIVLHNTAILEYEDGLASVLFDSGSGGSWSTVSWKES